MAAFEDYTLQELKSMDDPREGVEDKLAESAKILNDGRLIISDVVEITKHDAAGIPTRVAVQLEFPQTDKTVVEEIPYRKCDYECANTRSLEELVGSLTNVEDLDNVLPVVLNVGPEHGKWINGRTRPVNLDDDDSISAVELGILFLSFATIVFVPSAVVTFTAMAFLPLNRVSIFVFPILFLFMSLMILCVLGILLRPEGLFR